MTEPERPAADEGRQPEPVQPSSPYGYPPSAGQQPGWPAPPPPPGTAQAVPQQPAWDGSCNQPPYGQGAQPPFGAGQQPPVYPYAQQPFGATPPQPSYPAVPEPPKKKAWPWVLGGCLGLFLLAGISFVGCMSCAYFAAVNSDDRIYGYSDSYEQPYDDYDYGDEGSANPYEYGGSGEYGTGAMNSFSIEDIESAVGDLPGKVEDGRCTPGVYEVGAGKDIEPGRYYFEGSQDAESRFYSFEGEGQGSYSLEGAVVYFGNYYYDLEEGDAIAFVGADDERMYPAGDAASKAEAPYKSGLYRVGTDIPAGTYTIAVNEESVDAASEDCAAFVMTDLEFSEDSITETKYVARGGSQTVTVKDGDWLELYASTATPSK